MKAVGKIGLELLAQKGLVSMGRQIVTRFQNYPNLEKVGNHWVTFYGTTADKTRVLRYIKARLGVDLTCSME